MLKDILIVDDEKDIRELVAGILQDEGYSTRLAADSDAALEAVAQSCPTLVLLDIWLQGSKLDGLEVLNSLQERYPQLPVIIISGHGNIDMAVAAIRAGAYDYIEKPFKADKLLITAQHAIEAARLQSENEELRRSADMNYTLIGRTNVIEQLNTKIDKLAQANSRVMILGPQGSGKEATARQIHNRSPRASESFIAASVVLMGDDPQKQDQQLFGVEADGRIEAGLFEQAHRGTIYLDEICLFATNTQAAILKVLIDGTVTRIGGTAPIKIDVRVLSSCSGAPDAHIASGQLREDLYHRLGVVELNVPGLAERRDDIPYLVDYFIASIGDQLKMAPRAIAADVMAVLQSYHWHGNIRQLRNCIEHMMITSRAHNDDQISLAYLPHDISTDTDVNADIVQSGHIMALPLRDARERFEREYLIAQINRFSGNISRTAEFIGMERSALHRKLKSLGVSNTNHAKTHA